MALRPNLVVEPVLLDVSDDLGILDWPGIFGNNNPVELEIGSGKGTFLVSVAEKSPQTNFIGIEWAKAYADFSADRLRRHALLNCRIVRADAVWWIRCHVPADSISALHVYFPDPWPKARHHKRRLIAPGFMAEVARILIPGGKFRLVTDHAGYFEHIQQVLAGFSGLVPAAFDSPVQTPDGLIVGTNFERKYQAENRAAYSIAAIKPA